MSRFALFITLFAALVLSAVAQYENGLPDNLVSITTNVAANLTGHELELDASADVQLRLEEGKLTINATFEASLRADAAAEVKVYLEQLRSGNLIDLGALVAKLTADALSAAAAWTQSKLAFAAAVLDDLQDWLDDVTEVVRLRLNVTVAGIPILDRLESAFDAWIAHVRRRVIDAKVFLNRVKAEKAELAQRYLNARLELLKKVQEIKANPLADVLVNVTILEKQLVALLVEVKIRTHLVDVAQDVLNEANARLTDAIKEKVDKLKNFRDEVLHTISEVRAEWRQRRAAIADEIRRRVIAFVSNVTSIEVSVVVSDGGVSVSITVSSDAEEAAAEIRRRLELAVRTVLVTLAEVAETEVSVSVSVSAKKRADNTYTVDATIGDGAAEGAASAITPALAAGSLALLAFAQRP